MKTRKQMKVAEIVPVSCLKKTENNHYHMCLSHLVLQSETYASFYRRMSDEGKYVLMDNGAAEGCQLNNEELIEAYDIVNPTEIVLPDCLLDGTETIQRTEDFLNKYNVPYKTMFVPQGKNLHEWVSCCAEAASKRWFRNISSIGVSKFLSMTTNDENIRFLAAMCSQSISNKEIHLLGCHEGPGHMAKIYNLVDLVRGCDSAFAYIASQHKEPVQMNKRPEGEIDFLYGVDATGRLTEEMKRFEKIAGVIDNTKEW